VSRQRYVIEGTWSGYTSRQQRTVHCEVTTDEKLVRKIEKIHGIRYTDGTMLYLSVRPCVYMERVTERKSYTGLIRDCARHNVWSVGELQKIEDAIKSARDPHRNDLAEFAGGVE